MTDETQDQRIARMLLEDPDDTIGWASGSLRAGWKMRHYFPVGTRQRERDRGLIRMWIALIRWVQENRRT